MLEINSYILCFFFFFQAEDGIRDSSVTGVQTCALPISGTPTAAKALVRNLRYWNTSATPNVSPRTLQFVLTDGSCGISIPISKTIQLIPSVNNPPVVSLGSSVSYTVASPPVIIAPAATITDGETTFNDPGFLATLTVKMVNGSDADDRL